MTARRLGPALAAVFAATAVAGCIDTTAKAPDKPRMAAIDTPVGAGANVPSGGSEDFVVNVGRRTFFREASADLDGVAKDTLNKQADWLRRFPKWSVKIQGFSDDPGTKEANVALSARRAQAVRAYLVAQGVEENRISAKGYGRERLVRDCPDLSCKSQNRRVVTNLEGDDGVLQDG